MAAPEVNAGAAAEENAWPAPTSGPVNATVSIPGSKSLTNRYLVLGALGEDTAVVGHPLVARDTSLMADALVALGAKVEKTDDAWTITPGPFRSGAVETGLAGTVMRFIPPVAALADGPVVIDGDAAARVRPMDAIVDGLRALGVRVDAAELNGRPVLPLTVHGTGELAGGTLEIDASASSQFISALLLAAPRMTNGLDLRHVGAAVPSSPHIAMTCEVLRDAGIDVTELSADDAPASESAPAVRWLVRPGIPAMGTVEVEPDLSNAAPFLAAAMVTGGTVRVERWPRQTTQPGDELQTIFTQMGGRVERDGEDLVVFGPETVLPLDMDMHDVGELTPTIAAVAAFANGESHLRNIGQLRGHETDRLAALVAEFERLGARAWEDGDDLVIRPASLDGREMAGATLESYADHRLATFGAVIGLRVPGVRVVNIETTAKTLPGFVGMWDELLGLSAGATGEARS